MKLKNLVDLMAGHPFRGSIENSENGDIAVVQMKDVNQERGLNIDQLFKTDVSSRKTPDYLRCGDILFVGRGLRFYAVLVEIDLEKTVAAPLFFIIRVRGLQPVFPAYLAWYINQERAQKYFSKHMAGTVLPQINRVTLEDLPVILPPLEVQQHIVSAHICRLKEKALLEQLIEKKKQFLDQLLDQTLEQYQKDKS